MPMVEMWVHIDCPGCENKIRKALSKLQGVDAVEIDMAMQKVTVIGWADQKKVLEAVRKTRCTAVLCPYPLNAETNVQAQEYYHLQHPTPAHRLLFNVAPRSYNYHKHGYDDSSLHGYYQEPAQTHIIGDDARARFSDDNPTACSVM
ncbi:heavy metal-associated isoprenylated plant protein 28-like [Musa acuminata AAA Group]|uniref:(wild Malaysian banana) hypothetical protein n=1 Tax=Musa acuminata subsp. malaccensis TaxID=214687 RepID=A0A804JGR5_MUSAM|nr:PREDICTED: heavy metal-associated isoprenylated plant protein 22-like [Musa acuminata subsp. malaccensis]CAG1846398.1 unnamed protein product [Musa acuminata subsp. malaccensis]